MLQAKAELLRFQTTVTVTSKLDSFKRMYVTANQIFPIVCRRKLIFKLAFLPDFFVSAVRYVYRYALPVCCPRETSPALTRTLGIIGSLMVPPTLLRIYEGLRPLSAIRCQLFL